MQVLISGGAGFKNSGDEALLRMAVQFCATSLPDARLAYLANNKEAAASTLSGFGVELVTSPRFAFFQNDMHYATADETFRSRWYALHDAIVGKDSQTALEAIRSSESLSFIDRSAGIEILQAIDRSNVLLVHGGGILTSATRSRLWEQCLTAEIAAGLGKTVVFRSHQLGPYSDADDIDRARAISAVSQLITTRDKDQSRPHLLSIAPAARVIDQVDDALLLDTNDAAERTFLSAHGLSDGAYICVGFRYNPSVGIDDLSFERTARIVRAAYQRTGSPIVLLPQGPFDEGGLERLSGLLGLESSLVRVSETLFGPIAIAAHARLMIACPHHSLIFALRNNVPVISPCMGAYYLFKNIGSMRHFGLEDFVIDIAGEPEKFMGKTEACLDAIFSDEAGFRSKLRTRTAAVREAARFQDISFAEGLRRSGDLSLHHSAA